MIRRGERLNERGEGWLIAAALAVCLALSLAVYLLSFPDGETLAPVHAVSDAVRRAEMININLATADEIATLPGIGEALAGRIVQYRETHGDFQSLQELLNVDGLGQGRLEMILPHIYIE